MILSSQNIIRHWTDAGAWGTKTLIDHFNEHVQADPDRVCLVDPLNRKSLVGSNPERLTYSELNKFASAVAEGLLAKGIRKDDIVMVQLPNVWELAMLYLAVTRAGALISPMPMQWHFSELQHIASLTDAAAIVTLETFKGYGHVTNRIPYP
ncbi:MAG: AMP-binding protein [Syntrophales bacterium]